MTEQKENKVDFRTLIGKDREGRHKEEWSGTLADYLDLVRDGVVKPRLAHQTVNQMIESAGSRSILESADPRVQRLFQHQDTLNVYDFFGDFHGIEGVIAQIARYFKSAAQRGEESRQVLYLMGPVGSGKSSIASCLSTGLESLPRFYALQGCPMHEEPLNLIPRHLRKEFEKMLGARFDEGSDLCPQCRFRLKNEFAGRYEDFLVETVSYSKRNRRGVAVVPPVDPNNQDTAVLIGSEDLSKLDRYGEGDPRVLDLNGALNVGNRGIVEFVEVFKNETEYLHAIITATQEKVIPAPGRHGMIYVDEVIVAHSNEAEWNKFKGDHTNEAVLDRIVVVKVPYNLRLSEEVKIYEKIIRAADFSGVHFAPHTLHIASMFAVLSRLEPSAKCDVLTKLKIYNGEEVVEKGRTKKVDVQELRDDTKREGMDGISTRFIMKAIDNACSDSGANKCVNPISVREALIAMVKESDISDDVRKGYLALLQDTVHKEYLYILETEITHAFVHAYEEQANDLFQRYLDHAEAFVNKTKVKDAATREELQPDEGFLKSIEEQIAIIGNAADGFRRDVIAHLWTQTRRGEKVSYRDYEPLKEAIEKKLMTSVREITRIVTRARMRDNDQQEKYEAMVQNLLKQGYCMSCVDVVLKYAANNLWKD
jgi:serine protein kinase